MSMMRTPVLLAMSLWLAACGGDGGVGNTGDEVDAASGTDAAAACLLPSTPITCTAGNDAPCTSACGAGYCRTFGQIGDRCTQSCTPGSTTECPTGWSCNMMGRCRPPS
jgi:hypothetical protein